jgi:hypothetical protein
MYIYHHLGLGDHISCHGIVRHYCEQNDKVSLFVKPHNKDNIQYMYNDITNLELIVGDDEYVQNFIQKNRLKDVLYIGFQLHARENFIAQFYKMANVPIEYEYQKFYINRNLANEKELFDSLNVKENEYIFVHDHSIAKSPYVIRHDLPSISPTHGKFFDWIYTILNAKEIHCIDSSFICLVDLLDTKDTPIFHHRYIKKYPSHINLMPKPHKFWNTI